MAEGFFVNGAGISLEALQRRVSDHLGDDVVIKPSVYNVYSLRRPVEFVVKAYSRALTVTYFVEVDLRHP